MDDLKIKCPLCKGKILIQHAVAGENSYQCYLCNNQFDSSQIKQEDQNENNDELTFDEEWNEKGNFPIDGNSFTATLELDFNEGSLTQRKEFTDEESFREEVVNELIELASEGIEDLIGLEDFEIEEELVDHNEVKLTVIDGEGSIMGKGVIKYD